MSYWAYYFSQVTSNLLSYFGPLNIEKKKSKSYLDIFNVTDLMEWMDFFFSKSIHTLRKIMWIFIP